MTASPSGKPDVSFRLSVPEGGHPAGYGETFSPSELTGTASFTLPVPATATRRGAPEVVLQYVSGEGQGPFGAGMSLNLPSFSRRTSQGIPRYEGDDTFLMPGALVLVPRYDPVGGEWVKAERRDVDHGVEYLVVGYRPRVEGAFALVEHWVEVGGVASFWRTVDADNTVSVYGRSAGSQIFDPATPDRIFTWLLDETTDTHGNITRCLYRGENSDGVPPTIGNQGRDCRANRYPERILYGSYLDGEGELQFALELLFDYGERELPDLAPVRSWRARPDPFSSYRAGFEVRTYRLCRNIVMVHHFPALGVPAVPVWALRLEYDETPRGSRLKAVRRTGYIRQEDGSFLEQSMPPVELRYVPFDPGSQRFRPFVDAPEPVPGLVGRGQYRLLDLFGDGIAGVLASDEDSAVFWPGMGAGSYGPPVVLPSFPDEGALSSPRRALIDLDGNGHLDLVVASDQRAGRYANHNDGTWGPYEDFVSQTAEFVAPSAQLTDVDGDGRADLLLPAGAQLRYYLSRGARGFAPPVELPRAHGVPVALPASQVQVLVAADVFGDGLAHRVSVADGVVTVWANLGYGRFSPPVSMGNAPRFGPGLVADRILLVDVSGSGGADLLFVYDDHLDLFLNESGNTFSPPVRIDVPCRVSDLDQLAVGDVTGIGVASLVVSKAEPEVRQFFLDFCGGRRPGLLSSVRNNMGVTTTVEYRSSTEYELADRAAGKPWATKLSFPVAVVARTEMVDAVSGTTSVHTFQYRDGYFDPVEREFQGFGFVQTQDTEAANRRLWRFPAPDAPSVQDETRPSEPSLRRTWTLTGAFVAGDAIARQFEAEYWKGDPDALRLPGPVLSPEILASGAATIAEAHRALAHAMLRQEVFGVDPAGEVASPYQVLQASHEVTLVQPRIYGNAAVFLVGTRESARSAYDRDGTDPRIEHELRLEVDAFGQARRIAAVTYPRRPLAGRTVLPGQAEVKVAISLLCLINHPGPGFHLLGQPCDELELELGGVGTGSRRYFSFEVLAALTRTALEKKNRIPYGEPFVPGELQARLFRRRQTLYWNADLTGPLPLGEVAPQGLVHHDQEAVFPAGFVERVFSGRVSTTMLEDTGYVLQDGYWWNPGSVHGYDAALDYLTTKLTDPFGNATEFAYDVPYHLGLVSVKDPVGRSTTADIDYHVLGPRAVTSVDGNTAEVLFDPLGEVVASSIHGVKHGVFVGNMRLSDYVRQGDVTMAGILADPARYLQGASGFFFYDLDAWTRLPALPVHTVTLFRREWAHPPPDGVSTAPAPPTATVEYFDGTLRSLGTKSQVEAEAVAAPAPGEAVEAAPAGDGGATVWVAAGRVVYNQRSEVIRSYLPYVSPTPDFDANPTSPSFRHTYDALGRPVRTETPQGHETLIANAPWSKSYFDEEDTDPSSPFYNTPTIWSYEGHGFVIQETRLNVVNGGPKETLSAYFRVDIAGNRLRTVDPRFYDPLHPETAAHYAFINVFDMMDRPLSALSADAGLHLNLPDAAGRTTDAWDARGFHTAVAFDALHRPVSVHAQGNGLAQITELFEYGTDPDRNTVDELVRHRDEAGVIDLPAYDLLGNPVRVERRVLQECGRVVDWNDPSRVALMPDVWVIRRQYDATSRLVWEANADGSTTEYDFYRNGWLKSVSLRFAGDPIAGAGIVLTYDAAGQRRTATCGNGVERRYGYDQLSLRLQSLVSWHRDRPAVPLQDLRFRHDRVGNVVEVEDRAAPGATTEPSTGVYTYDAIYQLRSASGRQQAGAMAGGCGENLLAPRAVPAAALEPYREEYGIDRSGNLLRLDHTDPSGTVTCSLAVADNCNRAVPTEILEGNDPQAFFDASGNQVSQVPLRLSRFLDYDYRGCLLSAPAGTGPERICFLCDGAGNRVRKAVYADGPAGSVTIQDTLYLGSLVVVRGAGGGGPSLQTNWLRATADDGLFLVAQEKVPAGERGPDAGGGGEAATRRLRYQIDNQVASVTLEMDEAGHLLTYEEYFPYGRPSVLAVDDGDELGEKRYRFNGKELDHPTGLYYYGQRYYAPRAFRWLTPDPAGTVDGLNLYAFVRNSPVTYVDPTGLCRPGARGGNPPQRPFRDRMAEVFGVLLGGFSATRISLGRSPFNLRSALPVLSRFRLSFAATFISWGMYAGHNLIMLSRGNTRPRGQRHITADPDVTAPDPSEILPSQERTPRATPSDRLPSGTINPSSRLGAFQATAGMPRGSTGEGAHFFIGLLYFGFGNFGAHDIGNYFWHPRTQALLLSRNVGYPTQEVARGEYHLWVEVWRRTGHPMAFFGSSFNPTARARFQQAGGVISRIFPEALFPVQVPQSPPPPPKQD